MSKDTTPRRRGKAGRAPAGGSFAGPAPAFRPDLITEVEAVQLEIITGLYQLLSAWAPPFHQLVHLHNRPRVGLGRGFRTFGQELRYLAELSDRLDVMTDLEVLDDDDNPIPHEDVFPHLRTDRGGRELAVVGKDGGR